MTISEARLYLEHTSIDDFNLEEHQKQNRYEAIQVLLNTIDKDKEIQRLTNIIEKAVEYIKENAKYQKATINNNKYYSEYLINQVLNILNGKEQ